MLLLEDQDCMSELFTSSEPTDDLFVYPVDAPATMCLDILQAQSPEDEDSNIQFHGFTNDHHHHQHHHHHLLQHSHSQQPESPCSPTELSSRSPSVSSDSGKPFKPQYTAELEVLCRICGDRASGFHYGVHSCEGCKGFFRRTLKKQLVYKPCQSGSRCKIDTGTRNKCQYCRYQRCLYAGMSQDAVRFGRMPKVEREKLLADREELTSTSTRRIVELRSLTDLIKAAFRDSFNNTIFFQSRHHPHSTQSVQQPKHQPILSPVLCKSVGQLPSTCFQFGSTDSGHSTPSFPLSPTMIKVEPITEPTDALETLTSEQFRSLGVFRRYQELTLPVMEGSVRFAKKIPGFTTLSMRDQILLMKRNGFMVVHLALQSVISPHFIHLDTKEGALTIQRNSYFICDELVQLLARCMTTMDRVRDLNLTMGETALFSALLITQDCSGVSCPQQVEDLQSNLIEALRLELKHNHPKQRVLLAKLLMLVPDLAQMVEEFSENLQNHVFDKSTEFIEVMPLLKEIFDLESGSGVSSNQEPGQDENNVERSCHDPVDVQQYRHHLPVSTATIASRNDIITTSVSYTS